MVRWGDQSELLGLVTYFRGVVYQDYVKIDYSIWPVELLERITIEALLPDQLDVGYQVLLDKDQQTAGWKQPSYRAHIPARPTEEEYQALVEEFWWSTTYVARSLWRDDLVFAKWALDQDLKLETLRRMWATRSKKRIALSLIENWWCSGSRRVGCLEWGVDFNEMAVWVADMGRASSPRGPILGSSNGSGAALDQVGIGGVNIIHAENEYGLAAQRCRSWRSFTQGSGESVAAEEFDSGAASVEIGVAY
jgi:hypothetical protein